ncbi:MAG: hypothetical protein ACXWCY_14090 [Burkholderiales bacterium]
MHSTRPETLHPSTLLTAVIRQLGAALERRDALTLGHLRTIVQDTVPIWAPDGELLHREERSALKTELDRLIRRYGHQKHALDFVTA